MTPKSTSRKQRAPTIVDVAREAGVSPKTVSRVVNGNDYVSVETRERVQAAIDRLHFRMNRAASSLASNRSAILGLVIPDVSNPYYAEVVSGVQQVAQEQNYSVLLFNTSNDRERELSALQILEEHRADGIIYNTPSISEAELKQRLQRQRAAVLIGHDTVGELAGIVNIATYEAAVQAVDHLVRAGRQHIAYISYPKSTYPHRDRLRGVLDGMSAHQRTLDPDYTIECTNNVQVDQGLIRAFLIDHPEVDGIICYNDLLALAAIEACDSLGIAIPDDVAITGFDDISFSSLRRIALTTFHIPRYEVGVSAAKMLFNRIAGRYDPARIVLQTTFIQRGTTPPVSRE